MRSNVAPAPFPPVDGTQPCMEVDAELFFPKSEAPEYAAPAVAVCRRCPFIHECLAYALTHDVSGVWGGTNERQRHSLRRVHGISGVRSMSSEVSNVFMQQQIARLKAAGRTGLEIATALDISLSTVKRHLRLLNEDEDLRSQA